MVFTFPGGWINLRAMLIYRADFFVLKPGLCLFVLGLLLTLPLTGGSISIGAVTLSLYSMLFGLTLTVLGLESFLFGCLAQVFCDYGGASRRKWMKLFPYTQSVLTSLGLMACGLALVIGLGIHYVAHSFTLQPSSVLDHFRLQAFCSSSWGSPCLASRWFSTQRESATGIRPHRAPPKMTNHSWVFSHHEAWSLRDSGVSVRLH